MVFSKRQLLVNTLILPFLCLAIVGCQKQQPLATTEAFSELVNTFTATDHSRWFYFHNACRPFGMVSLSPDTQPVGAWKSGYHYDSTHIRCFSHIHDWQMSGVAVMPSVGDYTGHLGFEKNKLPFSHDNEISKPGYYKVLLDEKIQVELTATVRAGFHRITFPKSDKSYITFNTGAELGPSEVVYSEINKASKTCLEGKSLMKGTVRRKKDTWVYFYVLFDQNIKEFGGWENGELLADSSITRIAGKNAGAFVRFESNDSVPVLMKVGISYVSIDQAKLNLETEIPDWDFDQVVAESETVWNNWLGRVAVSGGTEKQRTKFYTDLFYASIGRHTVSDVDGTYCDMTNDEIATRKIAPAGADSIIYAQHSFDGLFGSHWSGNILWSLVYPKVVDELINTISRYYQNGGFIPRGPSGGNYTYVMIGDPASPLITSAYLKGIRNYDVEFLYTGMIKNAGLSGIRNRAGYDAENPPLTEQMEGYIELGYVPHDAQYRWYHGEASASMTLHYAYEDWAIAQLAKKLNRSADFDSYFTRSKNYKNIYDSESGYMRPRYKDGSWFQDFRPIDSARKSEGFCEANAMIMSHYVPHDPYGLIALNGGAEAYSVRLDSIFQNAEGQGFVAPHDSHAQGWVDYGNQEATAMAHMFNYSGHPWLSQKWVRKVYDKVFSEPTPTGGYSGDEDQGLMGSLSALMAMGLFQVNGGVSERPYYELSAPVFERIEINLDEKYYSGKKFVISVLNNDPKNVYINNVSLNGKELDRLWIYHDELISGGELVLELSENPNYTLGINNLPPNQ